jgi:DNA sulfur modification protein DndC
MEKLFKLQKVMGNKYKVVTESEITEIRKIWLERGDMEDTLPTIYESVFNTKFDWKNDDSPFLSKEDLELLSELCDEKEVDFNFYKRLLEVEKKSFGQLVRRSVVNKISDLLKMDYLYVGDNDDS